MVNLRQKLMRKRMQKVTRNDPHLADILERNIESLVALRRDAEKSGSWQDRLADAITRFAGSMTFLLIHVIWFTAWIAINAGAVQGIRAFDPYPFNFLTMVVSLEAIFLSTLVMISQNRDAALSDDRADLDLQIDMLGEYEITKILRIVTEIGKKLDIPGCEDSEILQLEQVVMPEEVMKEISDKKRQISDRK